MAGLPITPINRVNAAQSLVKQAAGMIGPGTNATAAPDVSRLLGDAMYELQHAGLATHKAPIGFTPQPTLTLRASTYARAALNEAASGIAALNEVQTGVIAGEQRSENPWQDARRALKTTSKLLDQVVQVQEQSSTAEARSNARYGITVDPAVRHGWKVDLPPARSYAKGSDWLGEDPRRSGGSIDDRALPPAPAAVNAAKVDWPPALMGIVG